MYVTELDKPWLDTPFLTQGFPILTNADIYAVRKECDFLFVDAERRMAPQSEKLTRTTKDNRPAAAKAGSAAPRPSLISRLFNSKRDASARKEVTRSIFQAKPVFEEARQLVRNVFDEVRLGLSIDTPQAKEVFSQCLDQVVENPDAMLLLTSIKNKDIKRR